jgi:hypothetical protein
VHWFREAVTRGDEQVDVAATREIIEIFTHRLGTPRRALRDLARIVDSHPGTPAAEWARRERDTIRSMMREEDAP